MGRSMDPTVAAKPRPRRELVMIAVQPLATLGVRALARLGVPPAAVVVTHAALGLAAALLVAAGGPGRWLAAAVMLLLKTLLDNMDGGLARATGRVTRLGRYLDTGLDLVVNAALFAALARHGPTAAALAGFAALTLLLSLDHNVERLYRRERGAPTPPPDLPRGGPRPVYRLFLGLYRVALAPQDRAIERLEHALFRRLAGRAPGAAPRAWRLAWWDLFATAGLVNLGLSTQLLALAVLLALGTPFLYVWWVLLQLLYAALLLLARALRFRRRLARAAREAGGA